MIKPPRSSPIDAAHAATPSIRGVATLQHLVDQGRAGEMAGAHGSLQEGHMAAQRQYRGPGACKSSDVLPQLCKKKEQLGPPD